MASSALAPPDVRDVTLSIFAGRKTDIAPSDLPEGLTADEQDSIYLPGEWNSRPGLARLYAAGKLSPGTTVLYEKTYVQPNDDQLNLMLTSDGILWAEDVDGNPGNPTEIGAVTPGLYAQSVSEFGREYIAFSDLLHGQGVPLQFDGTNLDRVTQDGPGAPPTAANLAPASATISNTGTGAAVNISTLTPSDPKVYSYTYTPGPPGTPPVTVSTTVYTTLKIVTAVAHGLVAGAIVSIAGVTPASLNRNNVAVSAIVNATTFKIPYNSTANTAGAGGTVTPQLPSLTRNQNVVTATTAAAHGFQAGWQVKVTGIANATIGGGIASISRDANGVVTVTTTTAHGLPIGALIAIAGVSNPDASYNGNFAVASVPTPTSFTYQQLGTQTTSTAATGNVQDIWTGTFFIQAVPTPTTFTYQQLGADNFSNNAGTAAVLGQLSPGQHNLVLMFLTRQGAITAPSPPVAFVANGGSQIFLSNVAIGPANVIARILGVTGAGGGNYFIIPAIPKLNGQVVGTSTVIPDNVSTNWTLDFSDNTLFAGIAIDQVGNDLFDQVVLGPVLGFFAYASRLSCWGDYNKVENFLNMGFCGGYVNLTNPLGWTSAGDGTLVNGGSWAAGMSWQITGDGSGNPRGQLTQIAYQDSLGDAIISPNTQYSVRLWAKRSPAALAGNLFIQLSSASTGFAATAEIPIAPLSAVGALTGLTQLDEIMPNVIPGDLLLSVYAIGLPNGSTLTISELEFIFTGNPYRDNLSRWSYALNPEAFAETTGNLGASDDQSPIRCFALLRQSSLLETAEGVHVFSDNTSEPDEWNVNQLTRSAGALSLRAGDPGKFGTGDAAEDWALVASKNGVYLFAGSDFWKVSQEISRGSQPKTKDLRKCWDDINWAAEHTIVAKNDPATRRAYFAVPINGALTPNVIFVLDYREMDTAAQIAAAAPLHITIQGKMRSSDLTRKWSVWNIPANDLEILARPANQHELVIAGGANAQGAAFGNLYRLDRTRLTDDDYGAIAPYYTTYFFTDHETEQALGIGSDLHLVRHVHSFITGVGIVTITPIVNSLYNFMPSLTPRVLSADQDQAAFMQNDLEWTCVGLRGQRVAFRISVQPLPGSTDVQLRLQKFVVGMMKDPIAQFRQSGV